MLHRRLLLLLFLATSCTLDLGVPGGAVVACDGNADCPTGLGCGPSGYCEAAGAGHPSAPTPTVSPLIGTVGTRFEITVRSESELAELPRVSLLANPAPIQVPCEPSAADAWLCTHTADGDELGGQSFGRIAFDVILVGADLGITAFEPAGTFELDFLVPAMVAGTNAARIRPDADNVLDRPVDLGPGSHLEVSLTLNKVLTESLSDALPPCEGLAAGACFDLWLDDQGDPATRYPLADAGTAGRFVFYELENPHGAALVEGAYRVRAGGRDFVGNTMAPVTVVDSVVIDNTRPGDLDPGDLDALLLNRAPWATPPHMFIGALPDGTLTDDHYAFVLWRDDSQAAVARLTEPTPKNSAGGLDRIDVDGDAARVYVTTLDGAGNASVSSPQLLPSVRWTATLHGKVPGSDVANPHELVTTTTARVRFPTTRAPIAGADGASELGGGAVETVIDAPSPWQRLRASSLAPEPRDRAGLIYERTGARALLFGGSADPVSCGADQRSDLLGDTWALEDGVWRELDPVVRPSPRAAFGMVATDHLGVVLFGGCVDTGLSDETFHFDGETWRALSPSVAPGPRASLAMAHDSLRGHVVLFGGMSGTALGGTALGDTWEWDGATWRDVSPSTAPEPRFLHAMAYDAIAGEVVLFGGLSVYLDTDTLLDDTWLWNGERWLEVTTASGPPASSGARMAFDENRGQVVLHGGLEPSIGLNDRAPVNPVLWAFDGTTWNQLTAWDATLGVQDGPPRNHQHNLIFDTQERVLVSAFGSNGPTAFSNTIPDVWQWNGTAWSKLTAHTPMLSDARLALEPATGTPLMHGIHGVGAAWMGGTWSFVGRGWSERSYALASPKTIRPGMAGDPINGAVLVSGGRVVPDSPTVGTWRLPAPPTAWQNPTLPAAPVNRSDHAFAYDENRGRVIMFGGYNEVDGGYLDELWVWETNDPANLADDEWIEPDRTALGACDGWPAARYAGPMAFDPVRGVMVLPGGHPADPLVWELDDTCWRAVDPAWEPAAEALPFFTNYAVAFDPDAGEVIVVHADETWTWNGTRFRLLPASGRRPRFRSLPAVSYANNAGALLCYDGAGQVEPFGNSWLWRSGTTATPAHLFHVAAPDTGTTNLPALTAIEARWFVGATSVAPGAELAIWERGNWRPVGVLNSVAAADAADPSAELIWSTTTDPAWTGLDETTRRGRLLRMFSVREPFLSFAASARTPATLLQPSADLATDYVEVTLEYRLD